MNDDSVKAPAKRWRPLRSLRVRPRLSLSAGVFLLASACLYAGGMAPAPALLGGFDLGAAAFLLGMLLMFNRSSTAGMRQQARLQDAGRWGILWSSIGITAVVMVALATELHVAKGGGVLSLAVAGASIVLSWLFINVMFALHYAHGFYGDYGSQHQGLEFPGKGQPDYWDFAYFSIVIGMTFQVSDVQISSREIRRIVLLHSVIAFFFNVFIIAVTVNIVAGQV
ncbi:DUF1345 domain-containing protein [Dyella thiooxydans]|uniref:DUF1345 domain-containing protein n=1 Tax=Dyella thiooxydans TaxID=445710 RepID=UPI0007C51D01|nr:DUF1345 domain-containing protein [Dyella thiooxydans]